MAFSASFSARSNDFFLSSARSNCFSQYSFLSLSSCCSCFSSAINSSHIRITLSNIPWLRAFFPVKAITKKSRPGRWFLSDEPQALRTTVNAWSLSTPRVCCNCTKLELPLGSVFLKRSKASSSFNILMVSDNAVNSSALVLERSSHSFVFVAHDASRFFRKSLSLINCASVSERSSFISMISTPNSPANLIFSSIESVKASTS
mmetsp:Transcript_66411/g.130931  ORF Transcript_66411/g.130931 Transcript_66411/m.130931 type:complete len:204 (-) Transcript_66411:821-1432(-)